MSFIRSLLCSALLSSSVLLLPHAGAAQPEPAGGISERPATMGFMLNETRRLVESKRAVEMPRQRQKLLELDGSGQPAIKRLARGTERWKYFHGAELDEIGANYIHDIQTIISRLLSCMRFRLRGVCVRIEFLSVSWTPLIEYNFPVLKVESVDQPLKSGYIPKELNELLLPATEATYHPLAPSFAQASVQSAALSAGSLGAMFGTELTQPQMNPLGQAGLARGMGITEYDEDKRWSTRRSDSSGHVNVEYHLMPEFFNKVIGAQWPWCHQIRNPWWFSDWPLMILPARFSGISLALWPDQMLNLMFVPQACSFKNITQGKTPADMLFPLAFNDGGLIPGQGSCQNDNHGSLLPVTNTANSLHYTDASRVATRKAMMIAEKLLPSTMYTYKPERGDRFQWSRSSRMPKGCSRIERWKLDEDPRANSKVDPADPWNVAIFWPRFTCCWGWRNRNPTFTLPSTRLRKF